MYRKLLKKSICKQLHINTNTVIHFCGIGGIGMSGIALILHQLNFTIQGSDIAENTMTTKLKKLGVKIFSKQSIENVFNAELFVKSSIIKDTNPELEEVIKRKIPVISRAEILTVIMKEHTTICVAGTHGKTTTTAMIAEIIQKAKLSPTIVNGGIINNMNTNAILGEDHDYENYDEDDSDGDDEEDSDSYSNNDHQKKAYDFNTKYHQKYGMNLYNKLHEKLFIIETDESDKSFLIMPTTIGIITNVDADHMENYCTFDEVKASYEKFIYNIDSNGFVIINSGDKNSLEVINKCINNGNIKCKIATYELKNTKDINENINEDISISTNVSTKLGLLHIIGYNARFTQYGMCFNIMINNTKIKDLYLGIFGKHNIENALSAIANAILLGIDLEDIQSALCDFKGVQRRFTKIGTYNKAIVIDDYAHHPVEIMATIKTAKEIINSMNNKKNDGGKYKNKTAAENKIIVIFQPHKYTRFMTFMDDFVLSFDYADIILVCDVYASYEDEIEGVNSKVFIDKLTKHFVELNNKKDIFYVDINNIKTITNILNQHAKSNDIILCLGAGNITTLAYNLIKL